MNEGIREKAHRAVEAGLFKETPGGILIPDVGLRVGGFFTHDVFRPGVGLLGEIVDHNLVVNQGLNYLLDVALSSGAQEVSWYVGLFKNNRTVLATDTATNFNTDAAGATEYDEAIREAWVDAGPSSQQVTNSASKAEFTMNATVTIYGAFLINKSAKDGSADGSGGVLFAASKFSVARAVQDNDVLLVTYTVQAQSSLP